MIVQDLDLNNIASARGWDVAPMWSIARRVDRKGYPDAELLSVYRDYGVIRKSDRDDNHNVESEDLSTYKYVKVGDLVLNKMKTWQGSLGVSAYDGIVSPAYFTCELSPSVYGPYIHYLLRSMPYIAMYGALSKGIRVGQWDLPYEEFRDIPVLLPPLEEQRRIADYLDTRLEVFTQVATLRGNQIELLNKALLAAITSDLAQLVGQIPVMRLAYVLDGMRTGTTPSESANVADGFPWYSPASINGLGTLGDPVRRITNAVGAENRWVYFDAGSVLIVGIGATSGRVAYLDHPASGNQQLTCLKPNSKMLPKFLMYMLKSKSAELLALANFTTLPILNNDFLKSVKVPVPTLQVQHELVSKWEAVEKNVNILSSVISELKTAETEYRSSLITAAVTGTFDVTNGRSVA